MFKFVVVFAAVLACVSAQPGLLAPTAFDAPAAAIAYANSPLYAAGGSSQIDVRHNYDGSLSSYTTAPFSYAGPYSSRYVAGAPAAYAAAPAALSAPTAFAAPARYAAPAGLASPYVANYAAPFAGQYAAPYATYSAGLPAAYGVASPFAAPAPVIV